MSTLSNDAACVTFNFRSARMAELKADVLVLGAGMVGVGAALHLQQRGRTVILVDRHERAGEETSHGNAGLIESASVFPYMFPRDLAPILQYALNRSPSVRYAPADLPLFLPWLVRYFRASSPARAMHSAMAELPLIRRSLIEHEALIAMAGVPDLLRRMGWIKLFRSDATLAGAVRDLERARQYGVEGAMAAREAVVALGPWSDLVFRPLGDAIPLAVKRGYHLHLAPGGNAVLNHPVLDTDNGYLLAPMNRGIRLTTGVEFARRDAPATPIQVERALPKARALFPLGDAIDAQPWKGARPCLPDMLPVIGRAPRHPGLWFDFGHQHHGLTLGPVTGRLLAEMMTGETPFADPAPFAAERFG